VGAVSGMLARAGRAVRSYVRAGPWTASLLVALVAVHAGLAMTGALAPARAWSSTNVANLVHHPLGSLTTSLFFLGNTDAVTPGTIGIVGLGIGGALWWLEARHGPATAAVALLAGHVGATVLTALVIVAAVDGGIYPASVLSTIDVGISYGAQAAAAAAVVLLPRWACPVGVAVVVAWPLLDADWVGRFPDFTTVGHLVSAALGLTLGAVVRRRCRVATPRPGPTGSRS